MNRKSNIANIRAILIDFNKRKGAAQCKRPAFKKRQGRKFKATKLRLHGKPELLHKRKNNIGTVRSFKEVACERCAQPKKNVTS
jgi:hypothetical protein